MSGEMSEMGMHMWDYQLLEGIKATGLAVMTERGGACRWARRVISSQEAPMRKPWEDMWSHERRQKGAISEKEETRSGVGRGLF